MAVLVPQTVKNLPEMAGDRGSIPGLGSSLEKGMATHSSIPAQRIPWTGILEGYNPWGHNESDMT